MRKRPLCSAALVLGAVLGASPARADVSSWLFTGAGPSVHDRAGERRTFASLQIDAGMGSPAEHAVSVGGLLRLHTHFQRGSDYGLFLRTATRGYNLGAFGLALDLGGYLRPWGEEKPGLAGTLSLGAPWGITLNADAALGPSDIRTYALVLGVDLVRLTVYRSVGLNWWSNPYPTPRRDTAAIDSKY